MAMSDEKMSAEQEAVFREMTAAQKLDAMEQLYATARQIKAAGLRMWHPDWPEVRIQEEVRKIFLYARS